MKNIPGRVVKRIAPRTAENLIFLSHAGKKGNDIVELVRAYSEELAELKAEMNEMRRNERRMAELYDLVFERVRADTDRPSVE